MKNVTIESSKKTLASARAASAWAEGEESRAASARYSRTRDAFAIELRNGVGLLIPRGLLQGLADATPSAAARVMVVDGGAALHWPTLDIDLRVSGLARGIFGTRSWMSELGRLGGSRTSPARAAASAANGRRGGRPRKTAAN